MSPMLINYLNLQSVIIDLVIWSCSVIIDLINYSPILHSSKDSFKAILLNFKEIFLMKITLNMSDSTMVDLRS